MDWRQRFWQKVQKNGEDGCWLWTGAKSHGYGHFDSAPYKTKSAHRIAYMLLVGPIEKGKQLDHLCRVRSCINPRHLEPVSCRENLMRGPETRAAQQSAQTHCKRGHEFTPENTYTHKGMRHCRECGRERARESWRRKNPNAKHRGRYKRKS